MKITKNKYGYFVISDTIANQYIERKYLYYTKKEAKKLFNKEVNQLITNKLKN
jgi:hypothetical protein